MFDKKIIKQRENKLEKAKIYLKTQFIGIDDIIDKFIDSVRICLNSACLQLRILKRLKN